MLWNYPALDLHFRGLNSVIIPSTVNHRVILQHAELLCKMNLKDPKS